MKKYYCIYKYTKEPQSTETDETDSDSDTKTDRTFFLFFFFFDWGYMCERQTTKLASQDPLQCSS